MKLIKVKKETFKMKLIKVKKKRRNIKMKLNKVKKKKTH